jgi:hypothetical protein
VGGVYLRIGTILTFYITIPVFIGIRNSLGSVDFLGKQLIIIIIIIIIIGKTAHPSLEYSASFICSRPCVLNRTILFSLWISQE